MFYTRTDSLVRVEIKDVPESLIYDLIEFMRLHMIGYVGNPSFALVEKSQSFYNAVFSQVNADKVIAWLEKRGVVVDKRQEISAG